MKSAKALYEDLQRHRQPFLDRARDASALTIPGLVPRDGHNWTTKLVTPWQSVGSRGVNNLASKLLLTLLPPNTPFFRLTTDPFLLDTASQVGETAQSEIEAALSKIERTVGAELETVPIRPQFHEAAKHLVVAGNVCLFFPPKGGPVRNYLLSNYVIERDPNDNILSLVTMEEVAFDALSEEIQASLLKGEKPTDKDKTVEIHTATVLSEEGKWKTWQEANGTRIKGSAGTYTTDTLPYLPLRWSHISGESYGRGHVEELLGDLKSAEGLSQAIVEGAAAAARLLIMVSPHGATRIKDVAQAQNGGVIAGNADDVHALQAEKAADLAVASSALERIERRLSFAFLLNSSVQRNAERVTAEEIRYMAQELEDTLGGVYSLLGTEFQLPLVKLVMARLKRQKRLPPINDKVAKPTIIAGLDALGRGHDLQRLQAAMGIINSTIGPEALSAHINATEYIGRVCAAAGVDAKDLIKSKEQLAQEAQQAQMAQLAQNVAPEVVKGAMAQPRGE